MSNGNLCINPLLWVHFRNGGGWRNAITLGIGYCSIAGILAAFTFQQKLDIKPSSMATVWLVVINLLQSGLLVAIGTGGIRRTIQQDFASGMMDSHRLTPMSGASAMFGYIVGPNATLLMLVVLNTFIGLPLCSVSGYPAQEWILGVVVVLAFATMLWSLSAVAAMATRGSASFVTFLGVAAAMGGWVVVAVVPGFGALVFGIVAATLGMLPGGGGILSLDISTTAVTVAVQLVIAATFFWAAARKYRRPDRRAFPAWLAMALLAEFTVIGGIGIAIWQERPRPLRDVPSALVSTQVIATMTALAVLAMLPISAMVHASVTWRRRRKLEPDRAGRRPPAPLAGVIGAAMLIVIVVGFFSESALAEVSIDKYWLLVDAPAYVKQWVLSFVVLVAGLIPPALVLRPLYRRNASGAAMAGLWMVLAWLTPPLIDVMLNVAMVPDDSASLTWLTGCSPVGALALVWRLPEITLIPGLAVQAAIIVGLTAMTFRRQQTSAVNLEPENI